MENKAEVKWTAKKRKEDYRTKDVKRIRIFPKSSGRKINAIRIKCTIILKKTGVFFLASSKFMDKEHLVTDR